MKLNENNNLKNLSLAKQTKHLLQNHGIRLNRNLGQNYLIDDFKRKKIIDFANINNNDIILEIGPGIGTLTLELAKKAKKVIAIEQDPKIFEILSERIKKGSIDNIELINEDALKTNILKFSESNKIVSNLPYQISSPITFKFLDFDFDMAILMYQKEFVQRMIAKVCEKNYSRLSAMLYFKAKIEFLDNIPPHSFIPRPKVNSAVVKLTPINYEDIFSPEKINFKELLNKVSFKNIFNDYANVCRIIFPHINKKIRNALIDSRHMLNYKDKKELRDLLDAHDSLDPFLEKRVISTSPEELLELTIILKKIFKRY
ncbi:putative ribosomal RNA small subunit methyltransferase A [Candidatus Methanobinarius endosymbioticus]|uniref:Probable ribosomal RNA small subunit methyltransferase A n=1 Tax=Candidatus Methanobinarius endosymbioticus TaxID=2006182 RepID=A0A366M8X9_9EURY|nr:putative ribosomal RNA small subunit methyltransferase A [Candidatus Methanobinarius endosymbioticus]